MVSIVRFVIFPQIDNAACFILKFVLEHCVWHADGILTNELMF